MSASASGPLVRLTGATLGYAGRPPVLEGVDLEVRPGEVLGVVGPNGSGKTTLLRALLGVTPLLAGARVVRGRLGYAPQRAQLDPVFTFTAGEVVAMGLLGAHGGARRAEVAARVTDALRACGLEGQEARVFRDLSGGQRQRALLARALVSRPDVLVLDEPTNDLDLRGEHDVLELAARFTKGFEAGHIGVRGTTTGDQGRTSPNSVVPGLEAKSQGERAPAVVLVSHQLGLVARHASRIALIHERRLVAGTVAELLEPARLEAIYGLPISVGSFEGRPVVAPARVSP